MSRPRIRTFVLAMALVAASAVGLVAGSAQAAEEQAALVTDVASNQTPRVVGGQCYGSVDDPELCRKISVMIKVGSLDLCRRHHR